MMFCEKEARITGKIEARLGGLQSLFWPRDRQDRKKNAGFNGGTSLIASTADRSNARCNVNMNV